MKAVGLVTKKIGEVCLVKIPGVKRVLVRGNWRLGEKVELDVDLLKGKEEVIVLRVKSVKKGEGELGVEMVRKSGAEIGKREVLTGTLCSQSKRKVVKATPEVLWDSRRIQKYLEFCDQYKLPASIVSWKYGIVPREAEVFNYDEFETKRVEHWVKVLKEARDRYGIRELYMWFDPSKRTMSSTILEAARRVFEKSGGTRHLYNLNRYLNGRRDLEDVVSSWIPVRSRVIVINSGDFSLLYHLTNEKYCRCVVYDDRPWAKEVQKAVIKRERIPKRLPEELPELLKHKNLTVRAAAILYFLRHKEIGNVDLSELREIGEILLKTGRYRRVEVRHVFPKILKNDIVLVKEPTSHSFLEKYFGETKKDFDWDKVMFKLGEELPSSVLIIREGKLKEVNSFYQKTGKYFSDRSVLTLNDNVVYRCA
ncbi:hypothetical protein J7J18_07085 [bacterium]|nr:hypothetical protein [bacterium]